MTDADLLEVIEEFCDDHLSSVEEDNADYDFGVDLFHNWCDASGYSQFKAEVPDEAAFRRLVGLSKEFAHLVDE